MQLEYYDKDDRKYTQIEETPRVVIKDDNGNTFVLSTMYDGELSVRVVDGGGILVKPRASNVIILRSERHKYVLLRRKKGNCGIY